jgi:hypothetical protein
MINDLIYVYCVSDSPPRLAPDSSSIGLNTLMIGDFCVFFKYVAESEFCEENFKKNIADIHWLETTAREHFRVISMIMEYCEVIPFKFGTIYNSPDSLRKFITDYSESLIENFHFIGGKEEWAIKIYCDRNKMSKQIDELSEDSAILEKQIMASSPGKAFLLKRKKSDLVESEMDRLCNIYGQVYYDDLKNLSESTCLNNLLPKEFTGRDDTMILNATFLVRKCNVTDFIRTVDALRDKDENLGLFIDATGPWPPFNFTSIKEKQ